MILWCYSDGYTAQLPPREREQERTLSAVKIILLYGDLWNRPIHCAIVVILEKKERVPFLPESL